MSGLDGAAIPMELLPMSQPEIRRLEACQRLTLRSITQGEAAQQLGLSERHLRRLWVRYRTQGPAGLCSRRRGRPSNRRLGADLIERALQLVRERYLDFGPTFANEKLREDHGIELSTESLRQAMIARELWRPKQKRPRNVHPPRERRPCFGELIQIDGSIHDWFEGRAPRCTLLVFIDDATSAIVGLRFVKSESSWSYLLLLRDYIATYGRPLALYSDRHTIFRAAQSLTTTGYTQVGRALADLDIELICATTPQAKGRVERANQTLQKRLLRELRLNDINSMEDANAFLPAFLEKYNNKFAVAPRCDDDAHRSTDECNLERILSIQHTRTLSRERTFQLGRMIYAIDDPKLKSHARLNIVEQTNRSFLVYFNQRIIPYRAVRAVRQARVLDAKAIALPADRHIPNQKKAHTPPPTHPWRQPWRRLPNPDISTWELPDITALG